MQIVIRVPDGIYDFLKEHPDRQFPYATEWVRQGTPLPKGHGDLVDRSKICKAIYAEEDNCTGMGMTLEEMEAYNDGIDDMYRLVQGAPIIIEADKEVEE